MFGNVESRSLNTLADAYVGAQSHALQDDKRPKGGPHCGDHHAEQLVADLNGMAGNRAVLALRIHCLRGKEADRDRTYISAQQRDEEGVPIMPETPCIEMTSRASSMPTAFVSSDE
jgi:hypothetical protein